MESLIRPHRAAVNKWRHISAHKFTICHSQWNFRSLVLRPLLYTLVACAVLLVVLRVNIALAPRLVALLSLNSSAAFAPNRWINVSVEFSNVRRNYSMQAPLVDECHGRRVELVALVMSRRESTEKRQGIRQSWARDAPKGVVVRFVVGDAPEGDAEREKVNRRLELEQRTHGDLIRYDIEDGYDKLHFKMSAAFQWQLTFCPNAKYVMKADDDTVLDLHRWLYWTEHKFERALPQNARAFFGCVIPAGRPIRDPNHKWYVPPEHFPGAQFPRYMQGATYVATAEAIRAVMGHTREAIGYNMDDIIFTGTLADLANATRNDYCYSHFRGGEQVYEEEPCEEGVPQLFAMFLEFHSFNSAQEYVRAYHKIHSLKCACAKETAKMNGTIFE